MTRLIRGISWDHPRGYDCLAHNVAAFRQVHPDIDVTWERRSLREFGEQPIDELADRYDLIIVDHPFSGRAAATGCLVDITPILGRAEIDRLVADSVGQSTISYHYAGGVYGLPTDVAAQVASYRPDLLDALGAEVPRTFADVIDLAGKAEAAGKTIATPASPTDAICLVLTYAANLGHPLDGDADRFIDPPALEEALARVEQVVAASHPRSCEMNPIHAYDAMSKGDDIVYIPLAFGYSNYARRGQARLIRFADIAGPGVDPVRGALLGGAGCAVTRSARDHEAIAAYLEWVHQPEHQRGAYFDAGGQPGSRAAWIDTRVNEVATGFFRDTLETLEKAYLRPRFDGFVPFFEKAGVAVNQFLRGSIERREVMSRLAENFQRVRADGDRIKG